MSFKLTSWHSLASRLLWLEGEYKGTAKEMMQGTSFAIITLLSCLGGVLGYGIKISVDRPLVIVSRGDDVIITCTYNTDTYIAWVANGSIPVRTLGIMTTGGHVRDQPGLYFNSLLIQKAGSDLNNTVFTCPLGRVNASSHLYVLDSLGPEIAAVYPLKREDPIVICWTPPPAYILAPTTRYHLKLTASTNEASTGDVTEVDLTAERGTCAAIDKYSVPGITYGRVYALSIAAENVLGTSVYTSTSIVVSLFKGSDGNADEGSDTDGFVVTTESVMNDEGHVSKLVNWKLQYQWTPFKYQFHCSCSHTPNVTMETAVMNITLHGPFTLGEECVVRVRACLRDDGCTWAISSKDLLFTAGTYLQNVSFQQTADGVVVSCEFAVSDQVLLCRVTFSIGTEVTRTVMANVMAGSSPPVASVVVSDLPQAMLEYYVEAVNVSDGMAIEDFRMTGMISLLPDGGDSVQPPANNGMLAVTSLAVSLGASVLLFAAVTTGIVVYYNCKAKRAKLRADANLAAAFRNELLNSYQLDPTDSGEHLRLSASLTGSAMVQWHHNKTAAANDDDAYMVMAGRRRSVCSPGPKEMAATIAKDNKAFAIYAEIGESAKVNLQ